MKIKKKNQYRYLWDTAEVELRGKFIAPDASIRKKRKVSNQ